MESIKDILMERDGMTAADADNLIDDARADLAKRLDAGEMPHDICEEWFGLEPDYFFELLPF